MKAQRVLFVLLVIGLCVFLVSCGSKESPAHDGNEHQGVSDDVKTPTALTDEELRRFSEDFFNHTGDVCLPNHFLTCEFDSAADVDLYALFYDGVSRDINLSIGDKEKEAVKAFIGGDLMLDFVKLPADDVDALLQKYIGLSLEETNKKNLDEFVWMDEYGAYYIMHGDTNADLYTFVSGEKTADGLITLRYETKLEEPKTTGIVTLRETEDGYLFVSNAHD